jgi:hypothetical protein
VTIDVQGIASIEHLSRQESYCGSFTCSTPLGNSAHGGIFAVAAGLNRLGVSFEAHGFGDFNGSRANYYYEEQLVQRDRWWAYLFRYTPQPQGRVIVTLVGGPAIVLSDIHGSSRQRFNGVPFGGLTPINFSTSGFGFAVGTDVSLPLTRHLALVAPIRYRRTPVSVFYDVVTRSSVNVGLGFSWSVVRRVYLK